MRALRNLLIFLAILVVIGFILPAEFRDGYYFYYAGRLAETTGNIAGAVEAYKTSSEANQDSALFARARARALNDLAESTKSTSKYNEAFRFCTEWIEKHEFDPGVWMLYIERARAEWGIDRKHLALQTIKKALDINPTDYIALVYHGIMIRDFRPGDIESIQSSIPIFEQAVKVRRHSRTYWAHLEQAKAFWMLKDENNALIQINQALAQYPPRDIKDEAERLRTEIQSSGRSR
ncbi:MAG TPA: hypothetical protein ENN67_04205 [Firmicutes bacterium]|nr:hypothetical protein [Bacillota bacterium]